MKPSLGLDGVLSLQVFLALNFGQDSDPKTTRAERVIVQMAPLFVPSLCDQCFWRDSSTVPLRRRRMLWLGGFRTRSQGETDGSSPKTHSVSPANGETTVIKLLTGQICIWFLFYFPHKIQNSACIFINQKQQKINLLWPAPFLKHAPQNSKLDQSPPLSPSNIHSFIYFSYWIQWERVWTFDP